MIIVTTETAVADTATDPLERLGDEGVSVWLDGLSRTRVSSGHLAKLVEKRHVVGVRSAVGAIRAS